MEVPSCTDWAVNTAMNLFRPNCYVEVGEDGVKAKRVFSVPFVSIMGANGHVTGDGAAKLNADMKARQAAADKRMRERYKSCKSE